MEVLKRGTRPQDLVDEILLEARNNSADEVICRCGDGQVGTSKFYLGLLSPVVFHILNDDVYSALGQVTLLLPDFSVRELDQLLHLPMEGGEEATAAALRLWRHPPPLLKALAVLEQFETRGRDISTAVPRLSPHVSPLGKKTTAAVASTASKPLSNCCEYIPDIYSIELFEPDYYLEDTEIQNEENLSLTIHSGQEKHCAGGLPSRKAKSKRVRLLSPKVQTTTKDVSKKTQPDASRGDCKLVLKIPKKPHGKASLTARAKNGGNKCHIQTVQSTEVFQVEEDPVAPSSCRPQRDGPRNFACPLCGKSFKKSFQLENHRRIHSGDRPFVCHTCGKAFNQEATLRTHLRIHSGSKPHACKECGESFVTSFALMSHLQWKHNAGVRPFLCSFCCKAFPTKQALSKHETIHKQEKKYCCRLCDKRFSRPDHLKSHMRSHPNMPVISEVEIV